MPTETPFPVLVIEDDEGGRENLRDILELDAYPVTLAGSIAETLALPNLGDIAAIILDRRLPDGVAEECLPRLRQQAPDAKIIIVTGYADLESAISALRQGASDYLLKPINVDLLRASLARLAERARMAAELKEAQRRAMQAERLAAIGEVYTGLAHESRNALQRSQACLERLAKRVANQPESLDLIARIQKAQDHLHRLYDEVRNYAAPMTNGNRMRLDLSSLLRLTWENLAQERQGRQASLTQKGVELDLHCWVDGYRIEQAFRNIIENALAACPDPVEITVDWSETNMGDASALQVSMRDNGPGLSEEARRRIFEPFFTTKTRGTGLGMAITRRVIEAHGGHIEVGTSRPGAEIVLTFPRGQK